jgi:type II restriction/modification system DNA methylase subunit YeeA
MDEKARRNLGAHYTSEANILKLIKPLFLDELHAEFERIKGNRHKLVEFHTKLKQLTFFDPACGCGNFLVISYRELRELELQVLRADNELSAHKGQLSVDVNNLIGVNVDQFYGIEIEEFPAQIAQVALWLVDHQMNLRVSVEFGLYFARIPLKSTPHIQHGNALRVDWNDVLPAQRCSYVLGNPPFLGKSYQSKEQKADLAVVMQGIHGAGDLDFVCGWYVLAAQYLQGQAGTQAAFVSTNSITQGEQVAVLWGEMQRLGMHINFAHRTFQWSNEASGNAAVHCVIVGFGHDSHAVKTIYEYEDIKGLPHAVIAKRINAYLVDAPDVLLNKRRTPICQVADMTNGSKPTDGGNLLMNDADKDVLLAIEPQAAKWIRPFLGAEEFINNTARWCLWLVDCPPNELRAMPEVMKRVQAVKAMRLASTDKQTQQDAGTPTQFQKIRQPSSQYLLIPSVSSERRTYVPIGFLEADIIVSNLVYALPNATLFHFGVMTSAMHNAFMRFTCGRLESRYRYSNTIVYNNYPWPGFAGEVLSDKHRQAIEQSAQCVLDARAQFASSSLADLYDPLTMPPALLKAHQKLDAAVDAAYQPSGGKKTYASDAERVAFLFDLYQRITSLLPMPVAKKTRKTNAIKS